eukprot:gnl/Dysnectes_brevis/4160_a5484_797.p1 GENE.gnl/Dysnectes_brevis/4160_a5484_797~~gnl/Dysnectes_brevis/4160_a5484_797.p1  ORF type:complete len:162 (+),score=6.83 gnl/Dysnectes_brevis/4160_a5484_797:130-615(+)
MPSLLKGPIALDITIRVPQLDEMSASFGRTIDWLRNKMHTITGSKFINIAVRLLFLIAILTLLIIAVQFTVLSKHMLLPMKFMIDVLSFFLQVVLLVICLCVTLEVLGHLLDFPLNASDIVHGLLGRGMYPYGKSSTEPEISGTHGGLIEVADGSCHAEEE